MVRLVVNDGQVASVADTVAISTVNSAPVANAGADQTALVTQTVTLNGGASSDVDGDALDLRVGVRVAPRRQRRGAERRRQRCSRRS